MPDRDLFELWLGERNEIERGFSRDDKSDLTLSNNFTNAVLSSRIDGFDRGMIEMGEHGKPVLRGSDLSFNLSHCGDNFALLLCSCDFCGVDIQAVKERRKFDDALRSVLTDSEYETIDLNGKEEDFFQLWSVKEAFVKAIGGSIWYGRDYDFHTLPGQYSDEWFKSNGLYLFSTEISSSLFLSMALPVLPDKVVFRKFP